MNDHSRTGTHTCNRCTRPITDGREVWLAYHRPTDTYALSADYPDAEEGFPFGASCATEILKDKPMNREHLEIEGDRIEALQSGDFEEDRSVPLSDPLRKRIEMLEYALDDLRMLGESVSTLYALVQAMSDIEVYLADAGHALDSPFLDTRLRAYAGIQKRLA